MKNFFALFLAMVMALSVVSVAFAAENYDADTTTQVVNGRAYEKVRMAITRDGHIAAVKTLKDSYSTLKHFEKEEIEKISHLKNGGIIRGKGLIEGGLDERNMLAENSTVVTLALEVINLEELQKALGDGVAINAVTVMDAASIYHNGHIGHRAIDRPTNLVARFHQKNGTFINVFYDVFDGSRKLVFDAEAVSVSQPAPEQPQPEQPQPEQPQPEQPQPEQPQPEQPQPEQTQPEPNPTLRDRNPVNNTGNSSSAEPNPTLRDRNPVTNTGSSSSSEPNPGLRGR